MCTNMNLKTSIYQKQTYDQNIRKTHNSDTKTCENETYQAC